MLFLGGHSRVLAHWACYKVAQEGEDSEIAETIKKRLGDKTHDISYCDIAAKGGLISENVSIYRVPHGKVYILS